VDARGGDPVVEDLANGVVEAEERPLASPAARSLAFSVMMVAAALSSSSAMLRRMVFFCSVVRVASWRAAARACCP